MILKYYIDFWFIYFIYFCCSIFFGIKLFFFLIGEFVDGFIDVYFFLWMLLSKLFKYLDIVIIVINMLLDNDYLFLMKMNVEK